MPSLVAMYSKSSAIVSGSNAGLEIFSSASSRVTFASGLAVIGACGKVIEDLRGRAAKMWGVDVEGVDWEDGCAKPSSTNVGEFEPLTLKEVGEVMGVTKERIRQLEARALSKLREAASVEHIELPD